MAEPEPEQYRNMAVGKFLDLWTSDCIWCVADVDHYNYYLVNYMVAWRRSKILTIEMTYRLYTVYSTTHVHTHRLQLTHYHSPFSVNGTKMIDVHCKRLQLKNIMGFVGYIFVSCRVRCVLFICWNLFLYHSVWICSLYLLYTYYLFFQCAHSRFLYCWFSILFALWFSFSLQLFTFKPIIHVKCFRWCDGSLSERNWDKCR